MASLERLLRPRTIAVIGGGTWCENVIEACRKIGFSGALWAVHPRRSEVAGCPAVADIGDLPGPPDAAFIGVNRDLTAGVLRALSARGAGGAVCFASGFSEAQGAFARGADLQAALVDAAGEMPFLGPNCYGFVNAADAVALWPDQHGLLPVDRGVAIVTQSSNIALNLSMQQRGLPISYLMTAGNQAQTGLSEIGQALLDDGRVTAIGLHIEGIDALARFEEFAIRAHLLGKPLVVLKTGQSEGARAATISHTASLAGSMTGAKALFRRLGIAQVPTLSVLLETLKIVHVTGHLSAPAIASMSCSGGEAGLIADMAMDRGVNFAGLNKAQTARLRDVLGPKVAIANPLDYHTYIWGDVDAMAQTFATMVEGGAAMGVVVLDLPRADRCDPVAWEPALEAVRRARSASGKPFAILSTLAEGLPDCLCRELISEGIIPLQGLRAGMDAITAASTPQLPKQYRPVYLPKPIAGVRTLDEYAAKAWLARYGLALPRARLLEDRASAAALASRIGFPVVLKATGIAHKSEAGGVALNLGDAAEVEQAARALPPGPLLIEEMVTGVCAELLVGILRDPGHGMVLTIAAGGVLTEILQDSVSLILPVNRQEVKDALERLRYAPVLRGYRGAPARDIEAVLDAIMAIQTFAMENPVTEVEVNPLLCGSDFAIAADALIRCCEDHDGLPD